MRAFFSFVAAFVIVTIATLTLSGCSDEPADVRSVSAPNEFRDYDPVYDNWSVGFVLRESYDDDDDEWLVTVLREDDSLVELTAANSANKDHLATAVDAGDYISWSDRGDDTHVREDEVVVLAVTGNES